MNGILADRKEIRQYLHMFQTSSPSYVLMASIDACLEWLSARGQECFVTYVEMLEETRCKLRGLENLKFAEPDACYKMEYDKSKIVISVKGTDWGSRQLYECLLHEHHLQMEMAAGSYVLAMTSVGDTEEGFIRLVNALKELDKRVGKCSGEKERADFILPQLRQVYTCAQVRRRGNEESRLKKVSLEGNEGVGCISLEYTYIYPPGIPIIVPGEKISEEAVRLLRKYKSMGFSIEGLEDDKWMEVWING